MIRFLWPVFVLFCGCAGPGTPGTQDIDSTIDLDELEGNTPTLEFATLCLSKNTDINQLASFAKSAGWHDVDATKLSSIGLRGLQRSIMEIPGGGGRYREAQVILQYNSQSESLIANFMARFDRKDRLVRTQCSIYAISRHHLPICAAVGALLKRPPDSNQRFKNTNAHFIRWNVEIASRPASVRCDGTGTFDEADYPKSSVVKSAPNSTAYVGTTISIIVDQASKLVTKQTTGWKNENPDFAR